MASGTTAADGTDWASVAILTLRFVIETRVCVNRKVSCISFSADSGITRLIGNHVGELRFVTHVLNQKATLY